MQSLRFDQIKFWDSCSQIDRMKGEFMVGLILFISVRGQCPGGWIRRNSSCYFFSHDTETWVDAQVLCKSVDSHLVTIETGEENLFLLSKLHYGSSFKDNRAWIGLNDIFEEGNWIWDNTRTSLQGFSNWSPGEPSNDRDDENCACVQDNGNWNDIPCHNTVHYVCEREIK